jgi:hypothetical protein
MRTPLVRSLPRNVWVAGFASFFMDVSSEMVLSVLPLFLANVLGVRTSVTFTWSIPLYGAYYGLAYGTTKAMIADLVPPVLRGTGPTQ